MDLEQIFYTLAIAYLVISLLLVIGGLVVIYMIWHKVHRFNQEVQQKMQPIVSALRITENPTFKPLLSYASMATTLYMMWKKVKRS